MHLRCRLKSCSSLCIEWHEKALWPAPPGDNATAECVPKVYRSGTDVSTGLSMPKGTKGSAIGDVSGGWLEHPRRWLSAQWDGRCLGALSCYVPPGAP